MTMKVSGVTGGSAPAFLRWEVRVTLVPDAQASQSNHRVPASFHHRRSRLNYSHDLPLKSLIFYIKMGYFSEMCYFACADYVCLFA